MRMCLLCLTVMALVCPSAISSYALAPEVTASAPNPDPTYPASQSHAQRGGRSDRQLTLKRDAATFHLHSGTVCFVQPVQGKVTGAVFVGEGNLILDTPAIERSSVKLLTKGDEFVEHFNKLVLRFTTAAMTRSRKLGAIPQQGVTQMCETRRTPCGMTPRSSTTWTRASSRMY